MATSYQIDFTDQNAVRSFLLQPYTTNGPKSPADNTLDDAASSAATSLLLFGKGKPDYGERMAENIIHLLEHFSGVDEPKYLVGGQVWLDRSESPAQLKVFNTQKHVIVVNIGPIAGNINYFTLADSTETGVGDGDLAARFVSGFKFRITEDGTDDQEDYIVSGSPTFRPGFIEILVTPGPPASRVGNWRVGGWEFMMQENAALHSDLDFGGWKGINAADPTSLDDITTKGYVDTAIATAVGLENELSELDDVNLGALADDDILAYDLGTGFWINQTAAQAGVLSLSGGTMLGNIEMSAQLIRNLANPVLPQDAATRAYVDAEILSVSSGAVTTLGGLSDVIITGIPAIDSMFQFDGAVWRNKEFATYAFDNNVLLTTGGTMTGSFVLDSVTHDPPTLDLQAATKKYVDDEITAAVAGSADGVVFEGSFDAIDQELTLKRTTGLSDVVISGFQTGGTTTDVALHVLMDPADPGTFPTVEEAQHLFWEKTQGNNSLWPILTVETMMRELNVRLGNIIDPARRIVVVHPPPAGDPEDYDISDVSPWGDLGFEYANGFGDLTVFVNGAKMISNENGWVQVTCPGGGPGAGGSGGIELYEGVATGLDTSVTIYEFTVDVNSGAGAGPYLVVLDTDLVSIPTFGDLVAAMNQWADDNPDTLGGELVPPFGVLLRDGLMQFYSSLPGAGSSVVVTDGGGAETSLFASMSGDVTRISPSSYTWNLGDGSLSPVTGWNLAAKANDVAVPGVGTDPQEPATYDYREVGRVGKTSSLFVWEVGSIPSAADVIEITIQNVMIYDRD